MDAAAWYSKELISVWNCWLIKKEKEEAYIETD